MNYSNTNKSLYDDIAIWKKTDGRDLFAQMPLTPHPPSSSSTLFTNRYFHNNLTY